MGRATKLFLPLLTALAMLGGCATQQATAPAGDWATHRDSLAHLQQWSFSGKVALSTPDGADTARLHWTQDHGDLELTLSGPVGMKQVTLIRESDILSLVRNGQRQEFEPGQDPLLGEFGWSLPLDYLPWWLLGLPAPQLPADDQKVLDGRLSSLMQAGWTVEYPDYQGVDGVQLPKTIRFRRDQVRGKILLQRWTLLQSTL